jgi:hypothetical protein
VTIKTRIEYAAFRWCEKLDDETTIVRDIADIFLQLDNGGIPPSEFREFANITSLAIMGRVETGAYIKIAFLVLKCNGLLERCLMTQSERTFLSYYENQMEEDC